MLPLSCTSAPPPTLGPNLSPPFVLPPPPHWKQSLLSPNLFLLNAHFLPREHGRTIELWDRLPSMDRSWYLLPPPSALLSSHLLPVCVCNTRVGLCLPHIFIQALHLQFSNFRDRSEVCYYWESAPLLHQIYSCDRREAPPPY